MLYHERQEILKGRAKRLIETGRDLRGSPFWFQYTDTIFFNKTGEQTSENSGWSDGLHYQIDFNFSYEDGHKTLELPYPRAIGKREYDFDSDGHLTEASYYNGFGFFNKSTFSYNSAGQLIGVNSYDKKGVSRHEETLSYKDSLILGEGFSLLYKYLAFDKHGNWTKRVNVGKDAKDKATTTPDTVVRKITYY